MDAVREALDERDLLLFVADAARDFGEEDRHALDMAQTAETPVRAGAQQNRLAEGQGAAAAADRAVQGGLRVRRLCSGFRAKTATASTCCAR